MSTTETGLGTDTTAEDPANATSAAPAADPQLHPPEGEPATPEQPKGDETESAPEAYEFTNPDGDEMSPEVLRAFGDAARELNLTQEGAQSLINAALPAMAEHAEALRQEQRTEWAEAARNDMEIGGSAFAENLKLANKALDRFGSPELIAELKTSGFGNHPELIRAWNKVGKAISEETMLTGGPAAAAERDLTDPDVQARSMYKTTHTQ